MLYISAIKLDAAEGQGFEVMGAGIPGLPALPFGTNGRVAWGPTSNWADVTDLYVEKQVEGKPGSYLIENGEERFTFREETFKIRTPRGFRTETKTVRASRHGVIVNDFVDRLPPDFPVVALRRTQGFGRSLWSMSRLYRAGSVDEARSALEDFTVLVGNWALADAAGSIGYAGPVKLPVRRTHLGTFPVPGWNGAYEWQGFVPAGEIPGITNPPEHYLASANNQIVQPESTGYPINFEGDVPHRQQRILDRLAQGNAGGDAGAAMRSIQTDGTDGSWLAVKSALSASLESLRRDADARTAKAAEILLAWDGAVDPESAATTIYQSFISHALIELLSDEVPPATLDFLLFYFNADPLLFGILEDPSNPAWDDRRTAQVEAAADVQRRIFCKTVRDLEKAYGGRVEDWRWKKAAPFSISHSLGNALAPPLLNRSGLPPRGDASTVFMHKYDRSNPVRFPISYGPVLRVVVDFADPSRSTISIPGGQSGRPFSPHYDDILPLFMKGEGVPMDMDFKAVEKRSEVAVTFVPDGATEE
jgi:penicillin amidase